MKIVSIQGTLTRENGVDSYRTGSYVQSRCI